MDSLSKSPIDKGWAGLPDVSESFNGLSKETESSPDERANKVKEFVSEGKQMNAAGYCSSYINNYFVWNTNGLNSSDSSSSAFIDGIFRTESSAGSSHRGGIILSDIEAQQAGHEAAKLAKDGENPEDIEPGNYEVILGHEAVSTILVFLEVYGFNAKSKIDGMSPINIDENQFDSQINILDTPEDNESIGFKLMRPDQRKKLRSC